MWISPRLWWIQTIAGYLCTIGIGYCRKLLVVETFHWFGQLGHIRRQFCIGRVGVLLVDSEIEVLYVYGGWERVGDEI